MRVGLTGGIGSGKSTVAALFESFGAFVIDTDELAREALAPPGDAFMQVARAWPSVVRNGALDRAALADEIFNDPAARERLNAIVHPHVRRLAAQRETYARPEQMVVHVVPLLFETDYAERVDASVLVVAPEDARIARLAERDRLDEARVRARMAAQISPEAARARADYVIENGGRPEDLRARARSVYEEILAESPRPEAGKRFLGDS